MRVVHTWHLLSASAFHVKLSRLPAPCSAASYLLKMFCFSFMFLAQDFAYYCLQVYILNTLVTSSLLISTFPHLQSCNLHFLIANPIYPIATLSGIESVQWLFIVLCPQNHRNLRWKRHDEVILSIPLANAELFPTV